MACSRRIYRNWPLVHELMVCEINAPAGAPIIYEKKPAPPASKERVFATPVQAPPPVEMPPPVTERFVLVPGPSLAFEHRSQRSATASASSSTLQVAPQAALQGHLSVADWPRWSAGGSVDDTAKIAAGQRDAATPPPSVRPRFIQTVALNLARWFEALRDWLSRMSSHPLIVSILSSRSYPLKSYALLAATYFLIGRLEFMALGQDGMWVNMLTVAALIEALLVYINLQRVSRTTTEAILESVALIFWWECLSILGEGTAGLFSQPGSFGVRAVAHLFKEQSPYIWWTFAILPISGLVGCSAFLFLQWRTKTYSGNE